MRIFPQYVYQAAWKRALIFCFDVLGSVCLFPWRFLERKTLPDSIQKILIIRLDHLGDVVMTRRAIRHLRNAFPNATIDLLLDQTLANLMSRHDVDRVIEVKTHWFSRKQKGYHYLKTLRRLAKQLRVEHYDLGLDFRGDLRNIHLMYRSKIKRRIGFTHGGGAFLLTDPVQKTPGTHVVDQNLELLQPLSIPKEHLASLPFDVDLSLRNHWARLIAQYFRSKPESKTLLIHPSAATPAKHWGDSNFTTLLNRLHEIDQLKLILLGTAQEKENSSLRFDSSKILDLRGQTKPEDLAALCMLSDAFLGNDSGPGHIAADHGLKCFTLFSGTNNSAEWRPYTEKLTLLTNSVPCAPCEETLCPLGHHDCMQKISVESVYQTVCEELPMKEPVN